MNLRVEHLLLLQLSLVASQCCDTVSVLLSGDALGAQWGKAGEYTVVANVMTSGRPVYQKGSDYLYFWGAYADWVVGTDYNENSGPGIYWLGSTSNDNAACPALASAWEYWNNDWRASSGISVACTSPPSPPCCDTVSVLLSGDALSAVPNMAGEYAVVANVMTSGRPVYQKGSEYLYFCPECADWMVGSDYNMNSGWLGGTSSDNAACPVLASAWEYWDGNGWQASSSISVACPTPPSPPLLPYPPSSPPPPPLLHPPPPPCPSSVSLASRTRSHKTAGTAEGTPVQKTSGCSASTTHPLFRKCAKNVVRLPSRPSR